MRSKDFVVLKKIIGYCDDIEYLKEKYSYSYEKYKDDISFQYSCNMCIIQIGELVNRLSDECMQEHDSIPWHAIRGMRNLHAHDYENVDLEIVWNTLMEDIPYLKAQISNML